MQNRWIHRRVKKTKKQSDNCWGEFLFIGKWTRIDKLMKPFITWTFWLCDVLVGGLMIGHYLSWTSIFNLFSFIAIKWNWLLFLLFLLPNNPEEGEHHTWARWMWVAMILVGFIISSPSRWNALLKLFPREKGLNRIRATEEFRSPSSRLHGEESIYRIT